MWTRAAHRLARAQALTSRLTDAALVRVTPASARNAVDLVHVRTTRAPAGSAGRYEIVCPCPPGRGGRSVAESRTENSRPSAVTNVYVAT
jgi:hypothetical protein